MVWLFGVRRIGKTTLCQSLDSAEYFDCELPTVRRQLAEPERFLAGLRGKRIVLDEIHRLPRPSEVLKIAADHYPYVKVVATGSSTLAATAKFSDTLAGRKVAVWLTPMMSRDLEEFGGSLETRLWNGGVPPFFLGGTDSAAAEFEEWLDAFWARDIQELFRIERRSSFRRFTEMLLLNSGGIFEATTYTGPCEASRPTISNYLQVLQETRVAHVLAPFSTRRASEIVKAPKVYALDTGFVRHARGLASPRPEDYGCFWEHYVLNEIHARAPLVKPRYWRTKHGQEVDFVVMRRGRGLLAVECTWSEASLRDVSGLAALKRAYSEAEAVVVVPVLSREYKVGLGGTTEATVVDLEGLLRRLV
ncbi:MAG: DUF4143 domain-containing protein [Thermoleophilia bacterium]|nr:DUF4143 domain-containing protein [Thermoleophilia bacterium]